MLKTIEINSSWGTLLVDEDGVVIDRIDLYNGEEYNYLNDIVSVNLIEHCLFWNINITDLCDIDCLDIYMMYKDGKIDKPEDMVRETCTIQKFNIYTIVNNRPILLNMGQEIMVINGYHNAKILQTKLNEVGEEKYYFKISE